MPIYKNRSDDYTMVHFGSGDLVVSTNDRDEVIITPTYKTGSIGDRTEQYDGKSTDNIPPGIRLVFNNQESIAAQSLQVVIDALQKCLDVANGIVNRMDTETRAVYDAEMESMGKTTSGPNIFAKPKNPEPRPFA